MSKNEGTGAIVKVGFIIAFLVMMFLAVIIVLNALIGAAT